MLNVLKATGKLEPFSEEKLHRSIDRAGIPKDIAANIIAHVKTKLYDNIPTYEITGPARGFALKMLEINRDRLLRSIEV